MAGHGSMWENMVAGGDESFMSWSAGNRKWSEPLGLVAWAYMTSKWHTSSSKATAPNSTTSCEIMGPITSKPPNPFSLYFDQSILSQQQEWNIRLITQGLEHTGKTLYHWATSPEERKCVCSKSICQERKTLCLSFAVCLGHQGVATLYILCEYKIPKSSHLPVELSPSILEKDAMDLGRE